MQLLELSNSELPMERFPSLYERIRSGWFQVLLQLVALQPQDLTIQGPVRGGSPSAYLKLTSSNRDCSQESNALDCLYEPPDRRDRGENY